MGSSISPQSLDLAGQLNRIQKNTRNDALWLATLSCLLVSAAVSLFVGFQARNTRSNMTYEYVTGSMQIIADQTAEIVSRQASIDETNISIASAHISDWKTLEVYVVDESGKVISTMRDFNAGNNASSFVANDRKLDICPTSIKWALEQGTTSGVTRSESGAPLMTVTRQVMVYKVKYGIVVSIGIDELNFAEDPSWFLIDDIVNFVALCLAFIFAGLLVYIRLTDDKKVKATLIQQRLCDLDLDPLATISGQAQAVMHAISSSELGMMIIDEDNKAVFCAKALARQLEYIPEEIALRDIDFLIQPEDLARTKEAIHRMLRNCTDRMLMEVHMVSKTGKRKKEWLVLSRFAYSKKWYACCIFVPEYLQVHIRQG